MLLKNAKRLPETRHNSLLLLCYLPVFSEQIWSRQEPHSHQGQVEQKMGNLAYEQALVFGPGGERQSHRKIIDTYLACSGTRDRYWSLLTGYE